MSHISSDSTTRSFLISPYVLRNERFVPKGRPAECPSSRTDEEGKACLTRSHHWRVRVTGPKHPILVMSCKTHKTFFTIYPSGFPPYQRLAVADTEYGSSGLSKNSEGDQDSLGAFKDSLFGAAIDAADGKPWLRVWVDGPRKWWETQRRYLAKALALFSLALRLMQAACSEAADILDIALLLILEKRSQIKNQPGYRSCGDAVVSVLRAILRVRGSPVVERLLLAGHQAGLWGAPLWWDAASGIIREVPFRLAR